MPKRKKCQIRKIDTLKVQRILVKAKPWKQMKCQQLKNSVWMKKTQHLRKQLRDPCSNGWTYMGPNCLIWKHQSLSLEKLNEMLFDNLDETR
nr:hypothetical protein [Cressdnaviricota sp.]